MQLNLQKSVVGICIKTSVWQDLEFIFAMPKNPGFVLSGQSLFLHNKKGQSVRLIAHFLFSF